MHSIKTNIEVLVQIIRLFQTFKKRFSLMIWCGASFSYAAIYYIFINTSIHFYFICKITKLNCVEALVSITVAICHQKQLYPVSWTVAIGRL